MKREPARCYKDKFTQRAYDGTLESFASGARGWIRPGQHALWTDAGRRFRGSSMHSAFWNGFDGLTRRGRPMYVAGSPARAAYMAGRDLGRL